MKLRRALSVVLTLFMIVTMLPTAVFADDAAGTVTATKRLVTVVDDSGKEIPLVDADGYYTVELSVSGVPVTTSKQPNADVILIIDNSGSMDEGPTQPCNTPKEQFIEVFDWWVRRFVYECPVCGEHYSKKNVPEKCTSRKTRMDSAKQIGTLFVESIFEQDTNRVAVIGFSSKFYYCDNAIEQSTSLKSNKESEAGTVYEAINNMVARGGTDYTAAFTEAINILDNRTDKSRPSYIIFISDGAPGANGTAHNDPDWNGSVQVKKLKDSGTIIYTAGIDLDDAAADYLKGMASEPSKFINVTGTNYSAQLEKALAEWAKQIKTVNAGKNAVMTDIVNLNEFILEESSLAGQTGVTYNSGTITWNIGDITETAKSIQFKVKPKDTLDPGSYHTNTGVILNYVDYNGKECKLENFGDPQVPVTRTVYAHFTLPEGYQWQDGTAVTDNKITLTFAYTDEDTASQNAPSSDSIVIPTGYQFNGWKNVSLNVSSGEALTYANLTGIADPAHGVRGDITFVADIVKSDLTVQFSIVDSEGNASDKAHYEVGGESKQTVETIGKIGESVNFPTIVADTGYELKGWKVVKSNTSLAKGISSHTITAADIDEQQNVVYIQAIVGEIPQEEALVDVIFTINDNDGAYYGESTDPMTTATVTGKKVDDTVEFPVPTINDGYELKGWKLVNSNTAVTPDTYKVAADDIEVVDNKNVVKILVIVEKIPEDEALVDVIFTINDNDGAYYGESTDQKTTATVTGKKVDDTVEFPVPTINEGYELKGWKLVKSNAAVTPDTYKVAADDIEVVDKKSVVYIQAIVASKTPQIELVETQLTLKTGSATKDYDESPLTCDELTASVKYKYSDNSLVDGKATIVKNSDFNYTVTVDNYVLNVTITGTITNPGWTYNNLTYDPKEITGLKVIPDYGTLTVNDVEPEPSYPIIINSWLTISNKTIAPAGFTKDSYTYEIYNTKNGKLLSTVTVKADSEKTVPIIGDATVLVVPTDAEVAGYTLKTTVSPLDATVELKVPDKGEVAFTYVYTVGLNTDDHFAYIFGYEDGTVRPEGSITRAEVATIFYRLLNSEAHEAFYTTENSFSDVDPDAWYNTAVSTLAKAGIITGYPDGTYNPEGTLTRAELVTLIAKFFTEIDAADSVFTDIDGHWAAKEITEAFVNGIIEGYDDGSFKPDQSITRAESMKIINGILGRTLNEGELHPDMKEWPDNADPDAWYYYIVQEATNSHEYEIGEHETWTAILPDPVWVEPETEEE